MGELGGEVPQPSTMDRNAAAATPDTKASGPTAPPKPEAPASDASADASPVFGPQVRPPSPDAPGAADGTDAGSPFGPESSDPSEIDARRTRSEQVTTTLLDLASKKWKPGLRLTELNGLSDAQFQLYIYRQLKDGFPEESYVQKDGDEKVTSEGKSINLTATDTKGNEVELAYLTEGKTVDGKRVYECLARDPNDSSRLIPVEVPGDELAKRHLAKVAEDAKKADPDAVDPISQNFSGNEQAVVKWYVNGKAGDPPSDEQLTDIEDSIDPLKVADKALTLSITHLVQELSKMAEDDPGRTKAEQALARLQAAQEVNGDITKIQTKEAALLNTKDVVEQFGGGLLVSEIDNALETLHPEAVAEHEKFVKYFEDQNVPEDKRPELAKLIEMAKDPNIFQDPAKFAEVLKSSISLGFPDIIEQTLGKNVSIDKAQQILTKWIDNTNLTEEQERTMRELLRSGLTTGGKNALLAVLIALAVGVGAAAVAGLATAETVGGLSNSMK